MTDISNSIKGVLDKEYKKKLQDDRLNDRINGLKKWDGYLDLEGKRDDKIDKLLKNY